MVWEAFDRKVQELAVKRIHQITRNNSKQGHPFRAASCSFPGSRWFLSSLLEAAGMRGCFWPISVEWLGAASTCGWLDRW